MPALFLGFRFIADWGGESAISQIRAERRAFEVFGFAAGLAGFCNDLRVELIIPGRVGFNVKVVTCVTLRVYSGESHG